MPLTTGAGRQRSGVEGGLFLRSGECPHRLRTPLLAELKAQLAGWTEAVRMRWSEGRARFVVRQRAQQILPKEALLTTHLVRTSTTLRHAAFRPPWPLV